MNKLQEAYEYCRFITKEQAKNFYWAFITLPKERRQAIYAAYAFLRECDDISDSNHTKEEKLRLLQEQRKRFQQCYKGELQGQEQDPVLLALRDVIKRYQIPPEYFKEVISGVEMDLTIKRYLTFEKLRLYCYRVAGAVGLISLHIFGVTSPEAKKYAVDLGLAMQLTNILRDIKEDAERDRIYIPQAELAQFGYSEEELFSGVINEPFLNLMQFQVERARHYFKQGGRLLSLLPLRSRPCPAIMAGVYQHILNRIEGRNYNVFDRKIGLSSTAKLFLTLRLWAESLLRS